MIHTDRFTGTTILLPAMDETYSLRQTVETIISTVNKQDLEEIIFLLCSRTSNETRCIAQQLIADYSDYKIYIHDQKLPFVGGVIREGIVLAKGSHVIMMSSDLETDPNIVQTFIAYAKSNPDKIITATRWRSGGGFSGYSKIKLFCNAIFERIIAGLFLSGLSDLTYAYRIFPSKLMKEIKWEELKHPFFLETALKPLRLGVQFIEVPAYWTARTEGVSNNSFWANFKYFRTAWHNRVINTGKIIDDM